MFKKSFLLSFLSIFMVFLLPLPAKAHGGPPFIKINGQINTSNQIFSGSALFKVTYESAKDAFVVGEDLNFQIEPSLLPVDPKTISESNFIWDFGDKTQNPSGLDVTHKYTKAGSYFVLLKVKDPNYTEAIEFESMTVNIVPDKNYVLPEAMIKVNGKVYSDPLKNPIVLEKGDKVKFDAGASKGKIKNYKWDFSDGSSLQTASSVSHDFDFSSPYSYSFFPILRVEDENGLISDAIVQISNKSQQDGSKVDSPKTKSSNTNNNYILTNALIAGVLLVGGASLIFFYFKKKS